MRLVEPILKELRLLTDTNILCSDFNLLQSGSDFSYVVAVAQTLEEITMDWKWLEEILVPTLGTTPFLPIVFICVAGIYLETFDEPLQAMDFAKAKIHSLVMLATSEEAASESIGQPDDPERMKFLEVETTFLRRFSMPQQEKLVNCESSHCKAI